MTTDPRPGSELAGYRIESQLGRGGMGVVYRAEQVHLGRKVALKLIAPEFAEDELFRERFLRESRLAAAIDHPNVIPIYDAGEAEGVLYLSMRYVEGEDLGALLEREGPLEPRRALALLSPVADALVAAHEQGLVHRDVKPGNVLIAGGDVVYLTDFGLTKRVALEEGLTGTGQLLGSLEYVAPEQIEGRALDGRADLYSLACVAVEALTGSPPFAKEQEVALIYAHLTEQPSRLSERRPELEPLDDVVGRALAKRPEDRQLSPAAFVRELRAVAGTGAAPPDEARPAGRRKRKLVTVVTVDLAGADQIDPEALERILPRAAELAGAALESAGARVERGGDAVTGMFGVPQAREDDALRAVRAAASALAALQDLSHELEQRWGSGIGGRAGVETGEVVVDDRSGTGNLPSAASARAAARLREAAAPGEVLLGETAHRVVREWVEVEEAAGGGWRVLEVLSQPRAAARPETRLVGRERERAVLEQALERAVRDESCQLLTLLGVAGVGKSRLVEEAVQDFAERAAVLQGRCLSYGEGITFFPLAEILRGAAGVTEAEPAAEFEDRLLAIVADDEDGRLVAARVAQLLGLAEGTLRSEEAFWAVRRLFEALARQRPLVVVVEDIHWAEPALLDLVEHVADWARGAPILVVCTARPELFDVRPAWGGGKVNAASILLEPLGEQDSCGLVSGLLGGGEPPPAVIAKIAAAAEGNPLFVEEMVAMLLDDQVLRRDNGGWVTTVDVESVPVPATIQAVLAARLDRLASGEKDMLERASVEGQVFHRGGIVHLSAASPEPGVGESLGVLVQRELIRPDRAMLAGEDAFRFRHILIRDASYGGLPKEERARLHELFAGWFEERLGDRLPEFEEIVAYHLDQALRYREELGVPREETVELARRAGTRLHAAGERSLARGDVAAAAALLGRAREVVAEPTTRIQLQLDLADALWTLGDLSGAEDVLDDAVQTAEQIGDARLGAKARIQRLVLASDTDPTFDLGELRHAIAEAEPVFERAGDDLGLARAYLVSGEVEATLCRWEQATAALERALDHAERGGAVREAMPIVSFIANCVYWGPTPADVGVKRCEELLEQARGHRVAEANVMMYLAGLHALSGDFDQSRALVTRSREAFEDLGYSAGLAAATPVFGTVELAAGNPQGAEREFGAGLEILAAAGETGILSTLVAFQAEALHRQERDEEALELTRVSETNAASDDVASQIAWRTTRARIVASTGDAAEAQALAREAVAIAADTDFLTMHAAALVALADGLRAAGAEAEGVAALREALALYERKRDDVTAARLRQELDPSVAR